MNFNKIAYPYEHKLLVSLIKKKLDCFFYDVSEVNRPILNPESILTISGISEENLKEVYRLDKDKVLRFDHTHVIKQDPTCLNQRNFGSVFRKGPRGPLRFRQFHQYDLDYVYENHQIRPILKLMEFLGPEFELIVNDLEMLKRYGESCTDVSYVQEFNETYKNLKVKTLDPKFIRGWDYYKGLIFEVYHPLVKEALGGGGVYMLGNTPTLGFSIGLNRLIELIKLDPTLQPRFIEIEKLIWIRYSKQIPYNLLDELQFTKIPYHLTKIKKSLFVQYPKTKSLLDKAKKVISAIVTVSEKEDAEDQYNYKSQEGYSFFSRKQLAEILKLKCT